MNKGIEVEMEDLLIERIRYHHGNKTNCTFSFALFQ